ncbi:MAG: NADPH2:quinone reductase [Bacteroidia bacterium]|jgi:NADPH2:quinone reductase
MKALQVTGHGKPSEALVIVDIEQPTPGPGEVCIRVATASLNFNDIDRCYGRVTSVPLTLPFTLGMDVCGEVVAAGEGATAWLGQKVVAITRQAQGGLAEYAIANAEAIFSIPEGLSDAEAVAFIMPFHTMYLALVRRAKMRAGDTVVIHAGASGLGLAGIQIAKAKGARVIATVGSDTKIAVCQAAGADEVINYREMDFADAVLKATNEKGAEIVCDLVGGDDVVSKSWQCVAGEGSYVMVGFTDDEENGFTKRALRPACAANFSIVGVMMAWGSPPIPEIRRFGFSLFSRSVAEQVHAELSELFAAGQLRVNIGQEIKLSDVGNVLEQHERRETSGKSVVTEFNWDV